MELTKRLGLESLKAVARLNKVEFSDEDTKEVIYEKLSAFDGTLVMPDDEKPKVNDPVKSYHAMELRDKDADGFFDKEGDMERMKDVRSISVGADKDGNPKMKTVKTPLKRKRMLPQHADILNSQAHNTGVFYKLIEE